jgi:hypothetical protein
MSNVALESLNPLYVRFQDRSFSHTPDIFDAHTEKHVLVGKRGCHTQRCANATRCQSGCSSWCLIHRGREPTQREPRTIRLRRVQRRRWFVPRRRFDDEPGAGSAGLLRRCHGEHPATWFRAGTPDDDADGRAGRRVIHRIDAIAVLQRRCAATRGFYSVHGAANSVGRQHPRPTVRHHGSATPLHGAVAFDRPWNVFQRGGHIGRLRGLSYAASGA